MVAYKRKSITVKGPAFLRTWSPSCRFWPPNRIFFPTICWKVPPRALVAISEGVGTSWWVLYTRPRQEKSLARDLLSRGIQFYLPLVPRRLLIRGRPVFSHVPLFSGYVFVHGSREDRLRSLMTNRVAQVISVDDGERLRRDLQSIQWLIESGAPLTIESRLEANQPVRVRAGGVGGLGRDRAAPQERNAAVGVGEAVAAGRVVGDRRLSAGADRLSAGRLSGAVKRRRQVRRCRSSGFSDTSRRRPTSRRRSECRPVFWKSDLARRRNRVPLFLRFERCRRAGRCRRMGRLLRGQRRAWLGRCLSLLGR